MSRRSFRPGDVVWAGESRDPLRAATWTIVRLFTDTDNREWAYVRSGRTEVARAVPVSSLSLFVAKESA